jgi:hypothetical protein
MIAINVNMKVNINSGIAIKNYLWTDTSYRSMLAFTQINYINFIDINISKLDPEC